MSVMRSPSSSVLSELHKVRYQAYYLFPSVPYFQDRCDFELESLFPCFMRSFVLVEKIGSFLQKDYLSSLPIQTIHAIASSLTSCIVLLQSRYPASPSFNLSFIERELQARQGVSDPLLPIHSPTPNPKGDLPPDDPLSLLQNLQQALTSLNAAPLAPISDSAVLVNDNDLPPSYSRQVSLLRGLIPDIAALKGYERLREYTGAVTRLGLYTTHFLYQIAGLSLFADVLRLAVALLKTSVYLESHGSLWRLAAVAAMKLFSRQTVLVLLETALSDPSGRFLLRP